MSIFGNIFGKKKSEEQKYSEELDRKEASERSYLPSVKSQNNKLEREEEKRYLDELKRKERFDIGERNKLRWKEASSKAFSGLVQVGKGTVLAGEIATKAPIAGFMYAGRTVGKGIEYAGSTEAGKYASARLQGAVGYVPSKFEEARYDYLAENQAKEGFKAGYRKHKVDTAETRGKAAEQRAYRKTQKKDIESLEKRQIEFEAQKSYRKERARAMGRREVAQLAAIRKGQQVEPIQVSQFGVPPQRPRRQWPGPVYPKNPPRQPTASEIDPMGIYTLRPQVQQQTSQPDMRYMNYLLGSGSNVQAQTRQVKTQPQVQAPKVNSDFVNNMLGFGSPSQSQVNTNGKSNKRPKRKVYNYFYNRWEWI